MNDEWENTTKDYTADRCESQVEILEWVLEGIKIDQIDGTLKSVCDWFITNYPKEVFINEPTEIISIRKRMEKIIKLIDKDKAR